jgi:hypothetical protein
MMLCIFPGNPFRQIGIFFSRSGAPAQSALSFSHSSLSRRSKAIPSSNDRAQSAKKARCRLADSGFLGGRGGFLGGRGGFLGGRGFGVGTGQP